MANTDRYYCAPASARVSGPPSESCFEDAPSERELAALDRGIEQAKRARAEGRELPLLDLSKYAALLASDD